MKIGIFDSGLGGLVITHALIEYLPQYDYVYLGDTARVPYGNRSQRVIYNFTRECLDYLFKQDCKLVIVACNSASAEALRKTQQEYLPEKWPDRKALGVLIPSAEAAVEKGQKIGIIATEATVKSKAFERELKKINKDIAFVQKATPLLVPIIESGEHDVAETVLKNYLKDILKEDIDTIILGCTHYPVLKDQIKDVIGNEIHLVSQDEVVPASLQAYLARHPEVEGELSKKQQRSFYVTDRTPASEQLALKLFGEAIELMEENLS